jgi:hypothetical protein
VADEIIQPLAANPSPFDGTWRPEPQRPGPDRKPDILVLADGVYDCLSCQPPYRVPADGREHAVSDQPSFDTIAITVVDERTVRKVGRKDGTTVIDSISVVGADGNAKVETQTVSGGGPTPFAFAIQSTRLRAGPAGGHALSGTWQVVEMDLVDHEEDTVYRVVDDTLTMSDGFGRSFVAKLDGTIAPYHGDPRFDSVSVRRIDERTIEESDRLGDRIVLVARWLVDPDGETIHVRFDDGRGGVMEQTGHRLG